MQTKVFYCCTVLKATSRRIYTTARCQDMTATFTETHVSVRYARSCQSPPLKLIKTKKNTNLLLLCVHAHREAHSIGLLSAWSTRSRALIAPGERNTASSGSSHPQMYTDKHYHYVCWFKLSYLQKSERQGHNEKTAARKRKRCR